MIVIANIEFLLLYNNKIRLKLFIQFNETMTYKYSLESITY